MVETARIAFNGRACLFICKYPPFGGNRKDAFDGRVYIFHMTKTTHGKGRKMNFGLPEGKGEGWRAKPTEKKLASSKVPSVTVLFVGSRLF